jgi:predicted alpha/beta hydrolase family esterase
MAGTFLILHGLGGSGPEHWQTWLAERLPSLGLPVAYPNLPDLDDPDPDVWLDSLAGELEAAGPSPTVICHSLACLLWLRAAARADEPLGADRVLLVSPPWREDIPQVARFLRHGAGAADVAAAATETFIVAAEEDPYREEGALEARFAGPLGLPFVTIPRAGHINPETGYGPWPAVEAWCLGEEPEWK